MYRFLILLLVSVWAWAQTSQLEPVNVNGISAIAPDEQLNAWWITGEDGLYKIDAASRVITKVTPITLPGGQNLYPHIGMELVSSISWPETIAAMNGAYVLTYTPVSGIPGMPPAQVFDVAGLSKVRPDGTVTSLFTAYQTYSFTRAGGGGGRYKIHNITKALASSGRVGAKATIVPEGSSPGSFITAWLEIRNDMSFVVLHERLAVSGQVSTQGCFTSGHLNLIEGSSTLVGMSQIRIDLASGQKRTRTINVPRTLTGDVEGCSPSRYFNIEERGGAPVFYQEYSNGTSETFPAPPGISHAIALRDGKQIIAIAGQTAYLVEPGKPITQLHTFPAGTKKPLHAKALGLMVSVESQLGGSVFHLFDFLTSSLLVPPAAMPVEPGTLPAATLSQAYSPPPFTLTGGTAPYTCTLKEGVGALPSGTTMQNCQLSGTPSVPGTFNFTVEVRDSQGNTGSRGYSLTVTPGEPPPVINAITPAAYNAASSDIGPGDIATIWGKDLASITATGGYPYPTELGGTWVEINGRRVRLHHVSPTQINFFVPDWAGENATMDVTRTSATTRLTLKGSPFRKAITSSGGIISAYRNEDGVIVGVTLDQYGNILLPNAPCTTEVCTVYSLGSYNTTTSWPIDQPAPTDGTLLYTAQPYKLELKGSDGNWYEAPIQYFGLTPGFVRLFQINFRFPSAPAGVFFKDSEMRLETSEGIVLARVRGNAA